MGDALFSPRRIQRYGGRMYQYSQRECFSQQKAQMGTKRSLAFAIRAVERWISGSYLEIAYEPASSNGIGAFGFQFLEG